MQEQQIREILSSVVITVYNDRSFSFITKTPPAAVLIKKACNIKSGSGVPNKTKVATITKAQVQEIAELKMPDLNADKRGSRYEHDRWYMPKHGCYSS